MKSRIKEGTVLSFNRITSWGMIALDNGKKVKFHSTYFQSKSPTRFPEVGEAVRATFSDGILVSVRSA